MPFDNGASRREDGSEPPALPVDFVLSPPEALVFDGEDEPPRALPVEVVLASPEACLAACSRAATAASCLAAASLALSTAPVRPLPEPDAGVDGCAG